MSGGMVKVLVDAGRVKGVGSHLYCTGRQNEMHGDASEHIYVSRLIHIYWNEDENFNHSDILWDAS